MVIIALSLAGWLFSDCHHLVPNRSRAHKLLLGKQEGEAKKAGVGRKAVSPNLLNGTM